MLKSFESRAIAGAALSLVVGTGAGLVVEGHTNDVARGKAVTAQACLSEFAVEKTVSNGMLHCLNDGAPGGEQVLSKKFKVGQPVSFVNTYISAQQHEAAQIEKTRLIAWSVSPVIGAACVAGWAAFFF